MSLVACDAVTAGLRDSEALAVVIDTVGRRHAIRVERDFLSHFNGRDYLPIGVIHINPNAKTVLVEFPHEPETGVNRIWVRQDQLDHPIEMYA